MSMMIEAIENAQLKKDIPDFKAGDTVVVQVKVKEGTRERLQAFEGVVIAKRHRGLNSSFTVRKVSHGEGVERTFQTHSPLISSIELKRHGKVKRAKLYYLRELSGRAARIKEKIVSKKMGSNIIKPEPKLELESESLSEVNEPITQTDTPAQKEDVSAEE